MSRAGVYVIRSLFLGLFLSTYTLGLFGQGRYYVPSSYMERHSTRSRIDFIFSNDGTLLGGITMYPTCQWPRGRQIPPAPHWTGFWFGCKKDGRTLVSCSNEYYRVNANLFGYFCQFVPGTIGDPLAATDTVLDGIGWKFSDSPGYIPYMSTDYDQKGVDQSGNNFPDWPIRWIGGEKAYVREMLSRHIYAPVYTSDEDFFSVFKDTETKADPEYRGPTSNPDSFSIPIGIEVRVYGYTWATRPLADALVLAYEVCNKSGRTLDSCFASLDFPFCFWEGGAEDFRDTNYMKLYEEEPRRNLVVHWNPEVLLDHNAPASVPYLGVACLGSPFSAPSEPSRLSRWLSWSPPNPVLGSLLSDVERYRHFSTPPSISPPHTERGWGGPHVNRLYGTGPFRMQPGDSVTVAFGIMFAEGLDRLLKLDDLVQRVYDTGFKVPSPPIQPQLSAQGVDKGVTLHWDDAAEKSVDPIIPDSLGKSFVGYRLYRSRGSGEPFVMIREWEMGRDSIVHDYLDMGQDGKDPALAPGGGLTNNIEYLYRLTAYDGGAPSLGVPEMESAGKTLAAVPQAEPSSPYSLDEVRVVPNPYVVEHAGQKTIEQARLFFNYLPVECTIRIYTVALDLVAELHHQGGSTEQWDLKTQAGQQVASQMFLARIETPQGTSVTKKFSIVLAE